MGTRQRRRARHRPSLLTLGGASAGANLALSALEARNDAQPPPAVLVLVYPLLNQAFTPEGPAYDRLEELPSVLRIAPSFVDLCGRHLPRRAFRQRPVRIGGQRLPSAGCRALVVLAEYDDLHNPSESFINAARDAGGTVTRGVESR
jgi:acetyl esterase/lipase